MESLTSADILGPDGRIAARLANYEHRPQQLEMADAVRGYAAPTKVRHPAAVADLVRGFAECGLRLQQS